MDQKIILHPTNTFFLLVRYVPVLRKFTSLIIIEYEFVLIAINDGSNQSKSEETTVTTLMNMKDNCGIMSLIEPGKCDCCGENSDSAHLVSSTNGRYLSVDVDILKFFIYADRRYRMQGVLLLFHHRSCLHSPPNNCTR